MPHLPITGVPTLADLSFCRLPGLSAGREDKGQCRTDLQDGGSSGLGPFSALPQEQAQAAKAEAKAWAQGKAGEGSNPTCASHELWDHWLVT